MAELKLTETKNGTQFTLTGNTAELDVIYRLLRCTKQNAEGTRWGIAKSLRDLLESQHASTLDYPTDEALSRDHFGMVVFKKLEGPQYP